MSAINRDGGQVTFFYSMLNAKLCLTEFDCSIGECNGKYGLFPGAFVELVGQPGNKFQQY